MEEHEVLLHPHKKICIYNIPEKEKEIWLITFINLLNVIMAMYKLYIFAFWTTINSHKELMKLQHESLYAVTKIEVKGTISQNWLTTFKAERLIQSSKTYCIIGWKYSFIHWVTIDGLHRNHWSTSLTRCFFIAYHLKSEFRKYTEVRFRCTLL